MTSTPALKAPFPYFGGKSRAAHLVWERLGNVAHFVEPFFGSGAVLLANPNPPRSEIVNDKDAFLANFWRAVKAEPQTVAELCDWPVNECDLEARHKWLVTAARKAELERRTKNDPDFYDAKIAAWWCWGLSCWIGCGWCEGEWHGEGDARNRGSGVNVRSGKMPHLFRPRGVAKQMPKVSEEAGCHRQQTLGLVEWFKRLSDRLRRVKVCCGDWRRVCSSYTTTTRQGLTGVFLDPPYSAEASRDNKLYRCESETVAHDVRNWCIERESDPLMRICLAGYEGEHDELESRGWTVAAWSAQGGYGNMPGSADGKANRHRERLWFSPNCIQLDKPSTQLQFA